MVATIYIHICTAIKNRTSCIILAVMDRGRGVYSPLFETKKGRGRLIYRLFSISLFAAICFIWLYRFNHIITTNYIQSEDGGKFVWFGMLAAELWFGFYWILTQPFRWNLVFRQPFKNRLSQRSLSFLSSYTHFRLPYHYFLWNLCFYASI